MLTSCMTTTQGSISASYEYRRGELTINVENTGAGVSAEELSHIFEHFSRDEKGQLKGSGLDMPIVQQLVLQMGGTIDIQSDYGKGTSLWVSIPCPAYKIEKKRK